jgi:hypothetical protein
MSKLLDPKFQARFHAAMTVFWLLMLAPALLFWKDSVLFVILISLWANVASHWASFQAAHAEKRVKESEE